MTRANGFLERVHTDLGGPLPPTQRGHQYYMTFTDDWSGATKVYTMRYKGEAYQVFRTYQAEIE